MPSAAVDLAPRPPLVTLDEASHVYTHLDGHRPPGVTTILGGVPPWLGLYDQVPTDLLEYKALLGRAVHDATWFYDEGTLNEARLDPKIAPFVSAWARFRVETDFEPFERERPVYHSTLGYAGRPDAIGRTPHDPQPVLVDIKTTAERAAVLAGPQTAAYEQAWLAERGETGVLTRWSVHLREDGTYRVVPHRSRQDFRVFLAALEIWNFMTRR